MAKIKDVEDWVKLPELEIPAVKDVTVPGRIVKVRRFGRLIAPISVCRAYGILDDEIEGMMSLSTVTIIEGSQEKLYRLPLGLNDFAEQCLTNDTLHFPCRVEFSLIRGKPLAGFIFNLPWKDYKLPKNFESMACDKCGSTMKEVSRETFMDKSGEDWTVTSILFKCDKCGREKIIEIR